MTTQSKLRFGIIGIGKWGQNLTREFSSHVEIFGYVHTGNEDNANALLKEYPHANRYFSSIDLFQESAIDAIVIATPIESHAHLALEALKHGKHVFVEKPAARNSVEMQEIVGEAKKQNLVIFSGYTFLYHPVYLYLKKVLKENRSTIKKIICSWNKYGTFGDSGIDNLMVHDFAIALDLTGSLTHTNKLFSFDIVGKDDVVGVQGVIPHGMAYFSINRTCSAKTKYFCVQTDTKTYFWEDDALYLLDKNHVKQEIRLQEMRTPLKIECEDFVEKVKKNNFWAHEEGSLDIAIAEQLQRVRASA